MTEKKENLGLDEIVSVEEIGLVDTYDFEIPNTHCFFANKILVHNTLEEEGDIVILLHRPFVYTKDPNDEGHALFDVAKARGAPERTINLYWDGKTTSFSNPPQEDEMWQN